jgi:hypothetical protein
MPTWWFAVVALALAAGARADSSPPDEPKVNVPRILTAGKPPLRVEVEGSPKLGRATKVTLKGAHGEPLVFDGKLDDGTPIPQLDRVLRLGPGGGEDPPYWYLLLGWSTPRVGLQTTHAWMVGVGKDGVRLADRFDVTTDVASAGFVIRSDEEGLVQALGLAHPGPVPREPGKWQFVMCSGVHFEGLSSFTALPYAAPTDEKVDWYRPTVNEEPSRELRARPIAWFSPTPCFHALDPNPRPLK